VPKVLIADNVSDVVCEIFDKNNIKYEKKIGLSEDELCSEIKGYDGLLIRSAVTVTKKIIDSSDVLKVIGRPGVGVDNVDLHASAEKDVIVMNTPLGNVQATAELTLGIIHSLMRKIHLANSSMHEKKWEKKKFIGNELLGKTLGIVGFGNIGKKVADFAKAYEMNVLVVSESASSDDVDRLGAKVVSFDEMITEADIITFHNKLSEKSKYIINSESLAKMKQNTIIINCARGGIINEVDMKDALRNNKISGYGCDVYEEEPQTDSIFSGIENVVMTPHIGAGTTEAQEKVAVQIANQVSDFLINNNLVNQVKA
jgi:D-3-phosphoglycerate dehydrogenase